MFALSGVPRDYAWGSRSAIPKFLGGQESANPMAELWFGTHPSAPSPISGPYQTLADLIAAEPHWALGESVVEEFGADLPFLFKLIAPDAPLSMQVHPSREQAADGLARLVTGSGDGVGDYVDANHKPELLAPFTEFEALVGLRTATSAEHVLDGLEHPFIEEIRELIRTGGVGEAFAHVLTHADAQCVEQIARLCQVRQAAGASQQTAETNQQIQSADEIVAELNLAYPGDRGVVASLLMEARKLAPGEAIFVPTGTVHAYLSGFGAEIMANSDNVLRAGLTPKHVDVPELLRVLQPDATPMVLTPAKQDQSKRFETPIRDFELTILQGSLAKVRAATQGPRIVMALNDDTEVQVTSPHSDGETSVRLKRGQAVFVGHGEGPLAVTGGRALHAGVSPAVFGGR